jgi:hypothetical protein
MNDIELLYHLENLQALDPDQFVSDLNISTDELLEAFQERALKFIREEFG